MSLHHSLTVVVAVEVVPVREIDVGRGKSFRTFFQPLLIPLPSAPVCEGGVTELKGIPDSGTEVTRELSEEAGTGTEIDVSDKCTFALSTGVPAISGVVDVEAGNDCVRRWKACSREDAEDVFGDLLVCSEHLPLLLLGRSTQGRTSSPNSGSPRSSSVPAAELARLLGRGVLLPFTLPSSECSSTRSGSWSFPYRASKVLRIPPPGRGCAFGTHVDSDGPCCDSGSCPSKPPWE